MNKVIVIGGGPAGLLAAGHAAEQGNQVTLIEKNLNPGKKLLITGKGRCNITNYSSGKDHIDHIPDNGKFLYSAYARFSPYDLYGFFSEYGLKLKVERGDRVFPASDRSLDVLKILLKYLKDNNVNVRQNTVQKIINNNNSVQGVKLADGTFLKANNVILAAGGSSYPSTGSDGSGIKLAEELGHRIVQIRPGLVPLKTAERWVKDLVGLRLRNVEISVYNSEEEIVYHDFGEMDFLPDGVGGPIILSASMYLENLAENSYYLEINLKPALSDEQLDNRILRDFKKYSRKNFSNVLGDLLPIKLIPIIINLSGIDPKKTVNQITATERSYLLKLLRKLPLTLIGAGPFEQAIVTRGGVAIEEIEPATMESKLINGLFFAGEVIDVAALTGGYNLQIAFSTGFLAGDNCT